MRKYEKRLAKAIKKQYRNGGLKMAFLDFTVEEINIVAMFLGATRIETITRIYAALPLMESDVASIAAKAAKRLIALEEKEYGEISFIPADETDG